MIFGKHKQVDRMTGAPREDLVQRLRSQGYEVEENVMFECETGVRCIDILARYNNGLIGYTTAVNFILHDDGREIELSEVFDFDDKAYNCGITDKALVAIPKLSSSAMSFAKSQNIKVFDKESLEAFLALPLNNGRGKKRVPPRIIKRSALLEVLTRADYKVVQQAVVDGKSGNQCAFDMLAYLDDGFLVYKVAVEVLSRHEEANIEHLSSFDNKAYDAGIDHKLLVTSTMLSPYAVSFAERHGIAIIKVDDSDDSGVSPDIEL